MKYKIRKTGEIVDVVGYSACTHTRYPNADYVCYIDNGGNEIIGRGLNYIWDFEPINEESANDFNWQSFRAEAARDILCSIIQSGYYGDDRMVHQSALAIGYANELCKQLKEKEEK